MKTPLITMKFLVAALAFLPSCASPGFEPTGAMRAEDLRIEQIQLLDRTVDSRAMPFRAQSAQRAKSNPSLVITPSLVRGDPRKFTTEQRTFNAMIMSVSCRIAEDLRNTDRYSYVAVAPERETPTGTVDFNIVLGGWIDANSGCGLSVGVAPSWLAPARGARVTRQIVKRWSDDSGRNTDPLDGLVADGKGVIVELLADWPLDADSCWALQARCWGVGPATDGPLPKVGPKTKALVQKLAEAERKAFLDPYQLQVEAVSERVEPALSQYCDAMAAIVEQKRRVAKQEEEARERASEARNRALVGGLLSALQSAGNNYGNPTAFQAEATMIQINYQSDINRVNDDLDIVLDANEDAMRALNRAAEGLSVETGDAVKAIQIEFEGEQVELQGGTVAEQMKSFRDFAKRKLDQAIKEDNLSS